MGQAPAKAKAKSKGGGGGGQYRAFCSRMLKSGLAKSFQECADLAEGRCGAELLRDMEEGQAATARHREGEKAFGLGKRAAARERLRNLAVAWRRRHAANHESFLQDLALANTASLQAPTAANFKEAMSVVRSAESLASREVREAEQHLAADLASFVQSSNPRVLEHVFQRPPTISAFANELFAQPLGSGHLRDVLLQFMPSTPSTSIDAVAVATSRPLAHHHNMLRQPLVTYWQARCSPSEELRCMIFM